LKATFLKKIATVLAMGALAGPVFAAQQTFDLAWSGATFGNAASATGEITFDPTAIGAGGQYFFPSTVITNASVTITGASAGNGTFDTSDLDFAVIFLPSALDFSKQLVGQSLTNGSTWGTSTGVGGDGAGGDFNLFANRDTGSGAPYGTWYFQLTSAEGGGDSMLLTSMAPAAAVPEAQNAAMLLAGLGLVGAAVRRRKTLA
jgi:hypothetical protein